jgi:hypothetical protein
MTLYSFTLLTSLFLGVLGFLFIYKHSLTESTVKGILRSQKAAVILLTIDLIWFLKQHVNNLGEADFGEYKLIIGLIGCCIAVASYFLINDFLAVRAQCILLLFYSREALDSAFLQEPQSRLFLVSVIYIIIIACLYFGAWPYRLRDFLNWLYTESIRSKILGSVLFIYSFILLGVAYSY